MIPIEHECGNGAALDDLGQGSLALFDTAGVIAAFNLSPLVVGSVPEGFDGADDRAVRRLDGCRGEK